MGGACMSSVCIEGSEDGGGGACMSSVCFAN